MINTKELELISQLTEITVVVAELKSENKLLKEINEKLMKALEMREFKMGKMECEKLNCCNFCQSIKSNTKI